MDGGNSAARTRVLVVDDHLTFAELLTAALDREPDLVSIGHATSAAEGIRMCRELKPDLVVMDVQLPDADGFTATTAILGHNPHARVIVLTAHATAEVFERAARAGACGFLPKDGSLASMLQTLRHARPGSLVVDPALVAGLATRRRRMEQETQHIPPLTPRESGVLELMGEGKDVRMIAKQLGLSPLTCRGYVKTILSKLGAHSQLEAVVIASRLNLIHRDYEG